MGDQEWAIIFLRPDGWWCAGVGWDDPEQAARDSKDQMNGAPFGIVPSNHLSEILCEEGLAELDE